MWDSFDSLSTTKKRVNFSFRIRDFKVGSLVDFIFGESSNFGGIPHK